MRNWMLAAALAMAIAGQARAEMADVEGGQLYYETCGPAKAQSIVLIHDGVVNSASFDEMWPILCRDFHVLRYDRRGYGKSPGAKAPYSPQDDLAAVMKAGGIEHASLVGFSFGGGLAVSYAVQHPDQVDRLVIAGPALNGFKPSPAFGKRIQHIMMPMIVGNMDAVAANAAREDWIIAPGHDEAKAKVAAMVKASPQDLRHQLHDPIKGWPSDLPRLGDVKAPTLILAGDHDIADNQAAAGAAQALIPGSKRLVIDDAGHLMQFEHPRELAEMVAEFVAKGR